MNLRYRHPAFDYRAPTLPEGCSSCGNASIAGVDGPAGLAITRLHIIDTDQIWSFGNNWGMTWDVWLRVYNPGEVASGRPTGVPGYQVLISQPMLQPIDFLVGVDAAGTGVFKDRKSAFIRDLRFFDAAGTLVANPTLGRTAILDAWNGNHFEFEVYEESPGVTLSRMTRFVDRNGNAVTATWKYAVNDPAMTGSMRTKLRIRDRLTDAYGRSLVFTYDETRQWGGCWVVTKIDLPTGGSEAYEYGTVANTGWGTKESLTRVVHADGSVSTFASVVDPATSSLVWSCDDPTADPESRRKTVYYSTSPWKNPDNPADVRGQIFGRARVITNGSGELQFASASLRFTQPDGSTPDYTYFYTQGRLEAIQHTAGHLPTARYARNAGDGNPLLHFTADWSGWTKTLGIETGPAQLGPKKEVTAEGHETRWVRDPVNDLPLETTYPDGTQSHVTWNTAFGLPLEDTDRLGRRTVYSYDTHGNRLSEINAVGTVDEATKTWTYWQAGDTTVGCGLPGQKRSHTDAKGNITEWNYYPNGDLQQVVEPADVVGGLRATTTSPGMPLAAWQRALIQPVESPVTPGTSRTVW